MWARPGGICLQVYNVRMVKDSAVITNTTDKDIFLKGKFTEKNLDVVFHFKIHWFEIFIIIGVL